MIHFNIKLPNLKSKVSRTYEMSRTWSDGVLEYWGIKRRHPTFRHYSSTPKLINN